MELKNIVTKFKNSLQDNQQQAESSRKKNQQSQR